MAQMTAQKHLIGEFNNNTGEEYGTQMSNPQDFTKIVENSVYATDKAESVEGLGLNQPDNTDANVVGTANVEITGTGASKKFKFNNLKGATGSQGIQGKSYNPTGVWSNLIEYINSSTIIDTVQLNGSTYWCKQTHTNQSPTEGTDNAYWGLLALKGSDSSVDILQTTGTSTTSVMSQDAVSSELSTINNEINDIIDGTIIVANSTNATNGVKNTDGSYQRLYKSTNSDTDLLNLGGDIISQRKLIYNTPVTTTLASANAEVKILTSFIEMNSNFKYELVGAVNTFTGRITPFSVQCYIAINATTPAPVLIAPTVEIVGGGTYKTVVCSLNLQNYEMAGTWYLDVRMLNFSGADFNTDTALTINKIYQIIE